MEAAIPPGVFVSGENTLGVALGDLDRDPEVLWAGGWPWSLRLSDPEPAIAPVCEAARSCPTSERPSL